jgi:hypothetical protein
MEYRRNDGGRADAGFQGQTRDCVCRAISIALELPYDDVYLELRRLAKVHDENPRTGLSRAAYEPFLRMLGWTWHPTMRIGSGCKVHLRAEELPRGRIIARVSKHLVAVIDGVIQDTHDPSRDGTRCVYGYYSKGAP